MQLTVYIKILISKIEPESSPIKSVELNYKCQHYVQSL